MGYGAHPRRDSPEWKGVRRRPLSPEDAQAIIMMANEGASATDISLLLGFSPAVTGAYLRELGVGRPRYPVLTDDEKRKIDEMFNNDMYLKDIASALGRNVLTIRRYLNKKYGKPVRGYYRCRRQEIKKKMEEQ
jgi:DNA invertase Pin-like site-specific DNA recombinase